MIPRCLGLFLGAWHQPTAQQAVLFHVYCPDVEAMHRALAEAGLEPGPVGRPFYNPEGEFRLVDPDGYVVMVAHL